LLACDFRFTDLSLLITRPTGQEEVSYNGYTEMERPV